MWLNSIFSEGPKIRSKLKTSFFLNHIMIPKKIKIINIIKHNFIIIYMYKCIMQKNFSVIRQPYSTYYSTCNIFFLSDKHKWILYNSRIYTDIFITQVETCTIILSSSCFSHFSMLPLYDAHCHTIYKYTRQHLATITIYKSFFFFIYFSLFSVFLLYIFFSCKSSVLIHVYIVNQNACINI